MRITLKIYFGDPPFPIPLGQKQILWARDTFWFDGGFAPTFSPHVDEWLSYHLKCAQTVGIVTPIGMSRNFAPLPMFCISLGDQ